ncbi:CHAT domain-containing protein [Dactylosporangium sp. CA-152071]|uniref:CHAT domain-containing protein n=1 Tax=Dactylosporangium sp. CA-152071 TaxID=3239933 RepID=UPI003D8C1E35
MTERTRSDVGDPAETLVAEGTAAFAEYWRTDRPEALDAATDALRRAVAVTVDGHPELAARLTLLRLCLQARFQEHGDPADLAAMVDTAARAVAAADPADPELPRMLAALSRASLTGGDVDGAVTAARQAVAATPPGHRYRWQYLGELGEALWRRYGRDLARDDLDAAADAFRSAAAASDADGPGRLRLLSLLSNVLRTRFVGAGDRAGDQAGDQADIDGAVRAARSAVDGTEPAGPVYAGRLFNLALALGTRADHCDDPADLDDAIDAARRSIEATPSDDPDLPERLAALEFLRSVRPAAGLDAIVAAVASGEVPLDEACDIARQRGEAGAYSIELLSSEADAAFQLVGADPVAAWRLGRVAAAAVRGAHRSGVADRRESGFVLLQADANLIVEAHALLQRGGDIRLYAAAGDAAREALDLADELGLPQARGVVLQRRGALVLDCYGRGPDGLHAQAFQDWVAGAYTADPDPGLKLAVAETLGPGPERQPPPLRWPDPVEALTAAADDLRAALLLVTPQRRGPVLKALGEALDWRERLGGPAAGPEVADVCRRALAALPADDVPLRLAVAATLTRAAGAVDPAVADLVDRLETGWDAYTVRPVHAWDAATAASAVLERTDPARALRLLDRQRDLAVVWEDEGRRTAHYIRSLALLARAGTPPALWTVLDSPERLREAREQVLADRSPAALTLLAVAAVRHDEDATGLRALAALRAAAPSATVARAEAYGFVEGQLLLGQGLAHERDGDHPAAVMRFLAAADAAAAVPVAGEVLRAVTCATDLMRDGHPVDLPAVARWCAAGALRVELAAPKAGPAAIQSLIGLLLPAATRDEFDVEVVLQLLLTAKGRRTAAQLTGGTTGWTPDPLLRAMLAEEVSRAALLPATAPEQHIDAGLTLTAYTSDYETSATDNPAGALANLRRAAERQILAAVTPHGSSGAVPALGDVAAALDARTALLVLYDGAHDGRSAMYGLLLTRDRCHLSITVGDAPHLAEPVIALGHDGRQRVHVPHLGFQVDAVRRAVQEEPAPRPVSRDGAEQLARLDAWALRAVHDAAGELRDAGIARLLVNPHGALHFAPLHLAGADGEPLADRFAVSYLANLAQLFHVAGTGPRRDGAAVFALGYEDQPALPTLASSAAEGFAIGAILGVDPVLDAAATPAAVLAALRERRWVHLRAHGRHDADAPMFQTVFLSTADGGDGRLLAHQIVPLDLRGLELVTLGACETSLGRIDPGDNLRGLSAALLTAGAHAVIGTLWVVAADASTTFFTALYGALHGGATVADAFRTAQLATRRHHPEYRDWGAFYLTGGHHPMTGREDDE